MPSLGQPHSSMATPASDTRGPKTPLRGEKNLIDSPSAVAPPPTVTQTRKRLSENDQPPNSADDHMILAAGGSNKAAVVTAVPSPQVIMAPTRNSLNIFDEAEKQKERSPSTRHASYEALFDMTSKRRTASLTKEAPLIKSTDGHHNKEVLIRAVSPKLGKVRTPDRVKLERLKTAAPLLPTRSTKPLTVPIEFKFSERKSRSNSVTSELANAEMRPLPKTQVNQIIKQTVRLNLSCAPLVPLNLICLEALDHSRVTSTDD